ncbi:MAG: tyrosine-type recombinase/integrase, partial [Streptosporangiaceae bacterium]
MHTRSRLCQRHHGRWLRHCEGKGEESDFGQWLAGQEPFEGYGACAVVVCPDLAASPLGLCPGHATRYKNAGLPGGASLPPHWSSLDRQCLPILVTYGDEDRFRGWCAREWATPWPGQVNLRGLRPMLQAEIRWTLFVNGQQKRPNKWDIGWIQKLVNLARDHDAGSLTGLDLADFPRFHAGIARSMLHHLRLVYFTPSQARDAGFIETGHFGIRFPGRASHVDLTGVPQQWLRDLLWDYLAGLLRSPRCPRTAMPVDEIRRAATELGAFLDIEAPDGGHDPAVLRIEHAHRFIADQRHRELEGLPSLAMKGPDGIPSTVTANTRCVVANGVRRLLRDALESGMAGRLGLDREFITAMPAAGYSPGRTARRPFPDEVARAFAEEASLARLAGAYDPEDQEMRDVWEAIVLTGRRVNEVLKVRWDCIGRYGGLAMFWHDQTKVGNYDAAIRIPERLYEMLAGRQRKTLARFTARHGRVPSGAERAAMALFPSKVRNPGGTTALSYQWFRVRFRPWVDGLDLGHYVAHQARHTLATNLLRQGATLTHIRRYLGHVSERMAEHYVHLSHSDLENVLQHVWVAGPGSASPGELLSGQAAAPLTREQAQAIAVDLARRSTPAEGGFCTFQPVVDGGACPWNLDCHNCGKF